MRTTRLPTLSHDITGPMSQKGPSTRDTHPPKKGHGTRDTHPLPAWTEWLTDTYENITFPHLRWRAVTGMGKGKGKG